MEPVLEARAEVAADVEVPDAEAEVESGAAVRDEEDVVVEVDDGTAHNLRLLAVRHNPEGMDEDEASPHIFRKPDRSVNRVRTKEAAAGNSGIENPTQCRSGNSTNE